jgi:hypothetical protein
MNKHYLLLIVSYLFVSCSSLKNNDLILLENTETQAYGAKSIKVYPKRLNNVVKGVCLIGGDDNELGDYCSDIDLGLKDKNGKIISTTKTVSSGHFSFTHISKGLYELIVLDKKYIKYSEKIFVVPGAEVLLHIKNLKGNGHE